jgi:hypothetical protein
MNKFILIDKMRFFKRLQRRFKNENSSELFNKLVILDKEIANNNIKWVRTYGKL